MKRDYIDDFCKLLETPKTFSIELAKVRGIKPLRIELRGIIYEKNELYLSETLKEHERQVTLKLSNRSLHADYSHSDIENAKAVFKAALKVNDTVLVIQTKDKQALIILDKVVKL